MLRNDIELVCDSKTIEKSHILRSEYATMIFRDSCQGAPEYSSSYFSKGYGNLKKRITMISRNLENKVVPRLVSAGICVVIIFICLTNPVVSQNKEFAAYINNYSELTGASRQLMHLANNISVSDYLSELSTLIKGEMGPEHSNAIGDGRLEDFKRIIRESTEIPNEIYEEILEYRTGQTLTAGSCALINYCVTKLISQEKIPSYIDVYDDFAPEIVSEEKMKQALSVLPDGDRKVLESCYNRGVEGARAGFSTFYTVPMFNLILSRITDENARLRFSSYYGLVETKHVDVPSMADKLGIGESVLEGADRLYVIDSGILPKELNDAEKIAGAACAGENSGLYYLKNNLEGYTRSMIRVAFGRAGLRNLDFILDYAKYGFVQYDHSTAEECSLLTENRLNSLDLRIIKRNFVLFDLYTGIEGTNMYRVTDPESLDFKAALQYLNELYYPVLRDHGADSVRFRGVASEAAEAAIYYLYDTGLIDLDRDGGFNIGSALTCGQSLYYAYRLVSMAKNVY